MINNFVQAILALKNHYFYDLNEEDNKQINDIVSKLETIQEHYVQKWIADNPNEKYPTPEDVKNAPKDWLFCKGHSMPYSYGGTAYNQIPEELAIKILKIKFGEDAEIEKYDGNNIYMVNGSSYAVWTPYDWYMWSSHERLMYGDDNANEIIRYKVDYNFNTYYLTEED